MFKVSHSKIKTWRHCRRQYWYKYVEKLRRRRKSRPLMMGSLIHDALDLMLNKKSPQPVFDAVQKELNKMFKEERIAEGVDTIIEDAKSLLDLYMKHYKGDGLKYLAVELPFEVELVPGVILVGKIDAIVEDRKGDVWIFERKTAKFIPEERVRASDIQTVIYRHVVPQLRIKQGRKITQLPEPRGVMWDYVRSKAPSIPHLNKEKSDGSREMSRAACDTTRSIYKAELEKHGLDQKDYQKVLDSLEGAEINFLRRYNLPFSKRVMKEVMNDFVETVLEMKSLHGISRSRNLGRDCSWCEFYNLCQADLHGHDRESLMRHDYEVKPDEENEEVQPE